MANEGSTKPTYSELEAENLRVRGLLQRGVEIIEPQVCLDRFCGDTGHVKVQKWLAEAKAGAESADIGKLDSADKKLNECNRHDDCAAAEAAVLARHPGKTISITFHCYDDECEDCLGQ